MFKCSVTSEGELIFIRNSIKFVFLLETYFTSIFEKLKKYKNFKTPLRPLISSSFWNIFEFDEAVVRKLTIESMMCL